MKKAVLFGCLVAVSCLLSGCLTDPQGRPVTPSMRMNPETGELETHYYNVEGREVVLTPTGVFVPLDQGGAQEYVGADEGPPPDPVVDLDDLVSTDPLYLHEHGYYYRDGHWYNGRYWKTHSWHHEAHGALVHGANGQLYRRGPGGHLVRVNGTQVRASGAKAHGTVVTKKK